MDNSFLYFQKKNGKNIVGRAFLLFSVRNRAPENAEYL